ncbi:MAG: HIT domain-containing protein [Patescibacteria group bacterium]|nr:HIT domain-containing protein [Patescibacteria group bacterium]
MNNQILVIPGITDAPTLACIARSRKYGQYCKAVADALAGACPFCNPDPTYNVPVEVGSAVRMRVQHCRPPEKNTRLHFLIIPRQHVKSITSLSDEEWLEVQHIIFELGAKFGFEFSGILIRNGDATQSAGTIQHLHIHVMIPDGTGRVESPFCKTPEEEAAGVARAIVFEKMRQGMPFESLSLDEQALVKDRLA